ncbi:hypothetical protein MUO14_23945 [Halobacillus shinanisalinarum]|uniref:Uncharacterized protein n=1 Tax=Halobacillus shinanisalinarum TaxID=2932258 RepID=A0ABY4GYV6_9BACI|nr:hypothetical protein [Halobacillus shinanisalinarum]UOQ93385.1 hypothetical protein MUO14_23945 [Halobacillus shinanisalinarum]
MKVVEVSIVAGASLGKFSIMEARLIGVAGERLGVKYLSCDELKEKGVIKRANSFNKAEKWLNTKEGLEWAKDAKHYQIF